MYSPIKVFIILCILILAIDLQANEEAPKEGKFTMDVKNPEWMDLNTNLQALKAKIRMKEEALQSMIHEKAKTKDQAQAAKIVSDMIAEHKELQKTITDYEEKRNLLKYRFPEAGLLKEREYERIEGKSLEDLETQWNLEGKIKKTVHKMKTKYGVKTEASAVHGKPVETKTQSKDPQNPLAEPLIISK